MKTTPLLLLAATLIATGADARPTAALRAQLRLADALGSRPAEQAVVARFDGPLTDAAIAALEADGVRFQRIEGKIRHVGDLYGVRVSPAALDRLAARPDVRSVLPPTPHMTPPSPAPLGEYNQIHGMTTADKVWPLRDANGERLTGRGRLLADIDSGIDPFHPMFFRADAGLRAWTDVDGNGVLDPGTDGVDMDGDGAIADAEVLRLLDVGVADIYFGGIIGKDGAYRPGWDWLYLDDNGNGVRDTGPKAGFTEQFPAYGEPLFTADDVDGSGVIEAPEKLMRLGTSKIRALMTVGNGKVYRRGTDLINAPVKGDASMHGTGVSGIILGGELGSQVHGVAPDAELLMIDHSQSGATALGGDPWADLVTAAAWARDEGAEIMVHEYGTQFGEFADGGSDWEHMLDTLSAGGVVQATATHNFAGYAGHAIVELPAGSTVDLPIVAQDATGAGFQVTRMILTARWQGAASDAIEASITTPDGQTFPLSGEQFDESGWYVVSEGDDSSRGTALLLTYVVHASSRTALDPLPSGDYTLHLQSLAPGPIQVQVSMGDDTGYAYTVHFKSHVSDAGTIAFPSTADSAISVGASVGNEKSYGEVDAGIKTFSGRGPRIDGAQGIDVVAPEDHYTAYPVQGPGEVAYTRFGGTSGALPQVAGALALLLQAEPGLSPADVLERVQQRSGSDAVTGATPNDDWGYGRLLTYRLVTGADPPANQPPTLHVDLGAAYRGQETTLDGSASSDPDDDATDLTWRWDVGYDGAWDQDREGALIGVVFDSVGTHVVKVEVEDPQGWTDTALLVVEVEEPPIEPEDDVATGVDGGAQPGEDAGVGTTPGPDALGADTSGGPVAGGSSGSDGGSGGCGAAGGGASWAGLLLLAAALMARRRRSDGEARRQSA